MPVSYIHIRLWANIRNNLLYLLRGMSLWVWIRHYWKETFLRERRLLESLHRSSKVFCHHQWWVELGRGRPWVDNSHTLWCYMCFLSTRYFTFWYIKMLLLPEGIICPTPWASRPNSLPIARFHLSGSFRCKFRKFFLNPFVHYRYDWDSIGY